jgi:ATP-dependent Clp protease ATP-binding subunit ClpX
LKLMEETEVAARSQQDIAGQIQAMMDFTKKGKKAAASINTKHILFIVSGALEGIKKITARRLREASIGFASSHQKEVSDSNLLEHTQTRDFVDFGFEPEFIGRLPVRVVCQPLLVEDLFQILKSSEGSIVRQYEQAFAAYGIEVLFKDEALTRIAQIASAEETGARGLMTVCERVFRNFKFELPSTRVQRFVVTPEVINEPEGELKKLMAEYQREERQVLKQLVEEFSKRFREAHGLTLEFTGEAADWLVAAALEQGLQVRDLCANKFKDYQFGLKLISQNTGQTHFHLDQKAVENPEKTLSEWVVKSYRAGA